MSVYIAKPITVTAYQYKKGDEDYFIEEEVPITMEELGHIGFTTRDVAIIEGYYGPSPVKEGDYIFTDEEGRVFVENKEIFENNFKKIVLGENEYNK
jgi:hypothetical protein